MQISIKDGVIDLHKKLKNNNFLDIDSPKYSNVESFTKLTYEILSL